MSTMQITIADGMLAGSIDTRTGARSFKGIPFAAPPVGALRWCAPQPVVPWTGVRAAQRFGPRAMQLPVFGDMNFRSDGMSEDCLYLNVWAPATPHTDLLPVLVYFYGGGNIAGDGSELRYDGAALAQQGLVVVTVNYRLNVFGFFAHPELSQKADTKASGNYGYLDQTAALQWVQRNIAAFGGDPRRVSIAGESAGSISVSAQMVSPLARGLFAGAIGSSGSLMGALPAMTRADAEAFGVTFATAVGATSLAALRALPAEELLAATAAYSPQEFCGTIDGYFLPQSPFALFAAGAQAQVPLLVGWNSTEVPYAFLLHDNAPTLANYQAAVQARMGAHAASVLQHYHAASDADVVAVATDLSSDLFIGYSTWKWAHIHAHTCAQATFRYLYAHPRPAMRPEMGDAISGLAGGVIRDADADTPRPPSVAGAVHSADIEYFMGNLDTNTVYAWDADDMRVSIQMQQIYVNFVTHGNPNGAGIPTWPALQPGAPAQLLRIDTNSAIETDSHQQRYQFLDSIMH